MSPAAPDTRPRKYATRGPVPLSLLDDPLALHAFMRAGDEHAIEGARAELGERVMLHEQQRTIQYAKMLHDHVNGSSKMLHDHVNGSSLCTARCITWPATKGVDAQLAFIHVQYAIEWPR